MVMSYIMTFIPPLHNNFFFFSTYFLQFCSAQQIYREMKINISLLIVNKCQIS